MEDLIIPPTGSKRTIKIARKDKTKGREGRPFSRNPSSTSSAGGGFSTTPGAGTTNYSPSEVHATVEIATSSRDGPVFQ